MDNVIDLRDAPDPRLGEAIHRAYALSVPSETARQHLATLRAAAAPTAARRTQAAIAPMRRVAMVCAVWGGVLAAMAGGAVAASQQAAPGQRLYGVKLGAEHAQLLIQTDPDAEAALLLRFAQRRLAEARQTGDPQIVSDLLRRAGAAVDEAERMAPATLIAEVATVRDEIDDSAAGLKGATAKEVADGGTGASTRRARIHRGATAPPEPFALLPETATAQAETATATAAIP
ncbi:MAG TPA: DUF5667 domain-containing protein [Egibacteraceae bacterium]|nr:DUF5667 domain-containing protein [Egibacteraceae bacterium]